MIAPFLSHQFNETMADNTRCQSLISVIILTLNEEVNLPDCLTSLSGLNCSIFVVDSGSTDRTIEIAQKRAAHVVCHAFENYAAQRNWGQQNLPITTDWVLHLDADERLTPALVAEIKMAVREDTRSDGFLLRKRTVFMGRWIRHGGHYPAYHLRLFRKTKGRCEERLYDQHFLVDGRIEMLENDYLDVVASTLDTWTARHVRWANAEAQQLLTLETNCHDHVHATLFGNPIERRRWLRQGAYGRAPLFLRPFLYFVYRYCFRFGFLDGTEGLIFHFLQGCWFRFLIDCKIYQARGRIVDQQTDK